MWYFCILFHKDSPFEGYSISNSSSEKFLNLKTRQWKFCCTAKLKDWKHCINLIRFNREHSLSCKCISQYHVWNSSFFWFDYILVSRTGLCSSSPCLNGGTCAEVDFGYICDCDGTGYAGDSCQRKYLKYPVLVPSELQKCTTTQASLWSKFFYKFFL